MGDIYNQTVKGSNGVLYGPVSPQELASLREDDASNLVHDAVECGDIDAGAIIGDQEDLEDFCSELAKCIHGIFDSHATEDGTVVIAATGETFTNVETLYTHHDKQLDRLDIATMQYDMQTCRIFGWRTGNTIHISLADIRHVPGGAIAQVGVYFLRIVRDGADSSVTFLRSATDDPGTTWQDLDNGLCGPYALIEDDLCTYTLQNTAPGFDSTQPSVISDDLAIDVSTFIDYFKTIMDDYEDSLDQEYTEEQTLAREIQSRNN